MYTTATERCCTHLVPVMKFQCFYPIRFERDHPRGAKIIAFRLTNEFVLNYEYSNGEGNVINFIEPTDDVLTVTVVLSVASCACAAHLPVC
jgi:hypothetical protein